MPPITSRRRALSTHTFISSTALSPALIETPAASYAVGPLALGSSAGWSLMMRPSSARHGLDHWARHGPRHGAQHGAQHGGDSGSGERVGGSAGESHADPFGVPAALLWRVLHPRQGHLEEVLAEQLPVGKVDGVLAAETGGAKPVSRLRGRLDHGVLTDVAEAVRADARRDLVDAETGGDQLRPAGEVDAVETGPAHRRGGDPHVDLGGTCLAQHPDLGTLGVPANDRVVDDHQLLAPDNVLESVQLEPDPELAQRLAGLDERAADVRVLDETHPVGDTTGLGVPD